MARPEAIVDPNRSSAGAGTAIPAVAWGFLAPIAVAAGLVLLLASARYGYFFDELYYLAAGRRLDWGYADQPPLLPSLAVAMNTLFGDSLVGMRLPSTIVVALGSVVAGLIARELGGRAPAQAVSAGAYALAFLSPGRLLSTFTFDSFLWAVIIWLVVRWVRLRDDRLLLAAGLATAVALQVKFLIPVFWVVLGVSVFLVGPRDLLRRPLLWVGAAIAVLSAVPTLIWQAANGWPQMETALVVAGESALSGGPLMYIPIVLLSAGLVVGLPLVLYGLWGLFGSPELRAYRFFGLTVIGLLLVFMFVGGRPYYAAGVYPLLFAVATVELQRRRPGLWRRGSAWPAFALSAVLMAQLLPLRPVSALDFGTRPEGRGTYLNFTISGQIGWAELTELTANTYHALPAEQRERTAVVASSYWTAAALDHYGPSRGLPAVYSSHRGFYYFGAPPESAENMLYVDSTLTGINHALYVKSDPEKIRTYFSTSRRLAAFHHSSALGNGTEVWLFEGARMPWSRLWPELRRMA